MTNEDIRERDLRNWLDGEHYFPDCHCDVCFLLRRLAEARLRAAPDASDLERAAQAYGFVTMPDPVSLAPAQMEMIDRIAAEFAEDREHREALEAVLDQTLHDRDLGWIKINRLHKALRYIIAQCGVPDPVKACRLVIATCERTLADLDPQ